MPAGSNAMRGKQGFQATVRPEMDLDSLDGFGAPEQQAIAPVVPIEDRRSSAIGLPSGWEPTDTYPLPQANDMQKIPAVLEAIDAGADTPESVSIALGMTTRQGSYYANSAGYLGLAEVDRTTTPNSWTLTGLGEQMHNSAPEDQARIMAEMVDNISDADFISTDEGGEDFKSDAEVGGLSEATAGRRLSSMRSWRIQTANGGDFALSISDSSDEVSPRLGEAVAKAKDERRLVAAKLPTETETCDRCFTKKALNGTCGCD